MMVHEDRWGRFVTWYPPSVPWPTRWTHSQDGRHLTRFAKLLNGYHSWTRWVKPWWWTRLLFDPPLNRDHYGMWGVRWCRLRGHDDPIYYSSGFEPDMRCCRCGEEVW